MLLVKFSASDFFNCRFVKTFHATLSNLSLIKNGILKPSENRYGFREAFVSRWNQGTQKYNLIDNPAGSD